jgi:hypothetical protein
MVYFLSVGRTEPASLGDKWMNLDINSFVVHDVAAFPIVWCRSDGMQPGFAVQWQAEMDDLLVKAQRFVMIFEPGELEETHEDRKQRGLWLKRNKQALAGVCLGVISIEPDALKRVVVKAQSILTAKAFGVVAGVAASRQDAVDMARGLLREVAN